MTDRVRRRKSTEGEGASGEYYVLDLSSGRYYSLGEVGGFIWERLDGGLELEMIADSVAKEFEVSESEARRDLLEFVESLAELGLIETGSAK